MVIFLIIINFIWNKHLIRNLVTKGLWLKERLGKSVYLFWWIVSESGCKPGETESLWSLRDKWTLCIRQQRACNHCVTMTIKSCVQWKRERLQLLQETSQREEAISLGLYIEKRKDNVMCHEKRILYFLFDIVVVLVFNCKIVSLSTLKL